MTVKITTEVHGLKGFDKALRELRAEMNGKEGNIIRNGLNYTARTEVKPDIVANTPVSKKGTPLDWYKDGKKWRYHGDYYAPPGRLRRAIRHAIHRNPTRLDELVGVGVFQRALGQSRNDPDGAWYAYIVEYKTGFMKNAFEKGRRKYINTIGKRWAVGIESAARKIGNKQLQTLGSEAKGVFSRELSGGG